MGKNLIQQARGKGSPRYRAPSFRWRGEAKYPSQNQVKSAKVMDLVHCQGHSAVLAAMEYDNNSFGYAIAPEGIRVGDIFDIGKGSDITKEGNVVTLGELPEGSLVCNIESVPGDGGKFVRASGTYARVGSQVKDKVIVILPSKKKRTFHKECRATIGIVSGGGRTDKPILKAGIAHHKAVAKNKLYPIMSGSAQNAVDHPFGNKRTSRKSKATPISRNAPPGRKVGMIAARRTGRKLGRIGGRAPKGSRGKKKAENKQGKSSLGKKAGV